MGLVYPSLAGRSLSMAYQWASKIKTVGNGFHLLLYCKCRHERLLQRSHTGRGQELPRLQILPAVTRRLPWYHNPSFNSNPCVTVHGHPLPGAETAEGETLTVTAKLENSDFASETGWFASEAGLSLLSLAAKLLGIRAQGLEQPQWVVLPSPEWRSTVTQNPLLCRKPEKDRKGPSGRSKDNFLFVCFKSS